MTQAAALVVAHLFWQRPEVDPRRFFIYSGSRGAVVASILAIQEPRFKGVILKSGVYDFVEWSNNSSWFNPIKLELVWEIGWPTEKKLRERSAYFFANQIKVPLLIIHGEQDDRAPLKGARKFAEAVNQVGGHADFVPLPSEHVIPMPQIAEIMKSFMNQL